MASSERRQLQRTAFSHGRTPEFGAGDANANCPPRFCHIGTKMSVLWPSKYAKIRFRPGLCPGPHWGSSRRSPRPLSRLERGHPSPYPTLLGTDPPSALAMSSPRSPARSTPMVLVHVKVYRKKCENVERRHCSRFNHINMSF